MEPNALQKTSSETRDNGRASKASEELLPEGREESAVLKEENERLKKEEKMTDDSVLQDATILKSVIRACGTESDALSLNALQTSRRAVRHRVVASVRVAKLTVSRC